MRDVEPGLLVERAGHEAAVMVPRLIILVIVLVGAILFAREYVTGEGAFFRWSEFWTASFPGLALLCLLCGCVLFQSGMMLLRGVGKSADVSWIRRVGALAVIPEMPDEALKVWMGSRGFAPRTERGGELWASRGRWSFIPGFAIRLALVTLLVGLVMSARGRETESVRLVPGQQAMLFGSEVILDSVQTDLPDGILRFGADSAFSLSGPLAHVTLNGEKTELKRYPPATRDGLRFRAGGVGLSLSVALSSREKTESHVVPLALLPPGARDVVPSALAGPLEVQLEPEKTIEKGSLTGHWYNLKKPMYRIFSPGDTAGVTVVPPAAVAAGDLRITIKPDPPLWVDVQAVRDPGYRFVFFGIWVFGGGLVLALGRFHWYRRDVVFQTLPDGQILFGYGEEFFRKWALYRFHSWVQDFKTSDATDRSECDATKGRTD